MKYIFSFDGFRIGDKIAGCYLLQNEMHNNNKKMIHIVDFDADSPRSFSVQKYFPDICRFGYSKHHGVVPANTYAKIEFGNLWISAPNTLMETGEVPKMTTYGKSAKKWITIHGLYDAPYNIGRNHKREQIMELYQLLSDWGKFPVKIIPDSGMTIEQIIDDILFGSILHIGGDTGITHIAAALGKPIAAIYGDNTHDVAAFDGERISKGLKYGWSSDPISKDYRKFVMKDNEFDVNEVFKYCKAKILEVMK